MNRLIVTLGTLVIAAHVAAAQSIPNIMKPKQAAAKAVAATNEHTAAMTTLPSDSGKADTTRSVEAPLSKRTATDSAAGSTAVSASPAHGTFERESFNYDRSGRRDPFVSLMTTNDLRPLITDLKLVGVAFDPTGRSSFAVLRDVGTKDQYRVRVGNTLGRMRVSAITTKSVVFTIEEFGYSRQETLALGDSNTERKQ